MNLAMCADAYPKHAVDSQDASSPELGLVEKALTGNTEAVQALVHRLRPAVQAEVGWSLVNNGRRRGARDPQQEVADLVQEVFVSLWENEGKILRAWNPEKGRSLVSFVRLVARHQVISILRSKKRSPWTEEPTEADDLELSTTSGQEEALDQSQAVKLILQHVHQGQSTRGRLLFEGLYIEGKEVDDICDEFGMTRNAVYAWKTRLRRDLRKFAQRFGIGVEP